MGKTTGSIKEGIGFIPNNTFTCDCEISSLDFGEYAVTMANSQKTLALLKECFNPQDAVTIYTVAMIHFIQGFTYLRDIHSYYDMSVLSIRYPSLKLGYDALLKLYDALGRRQGNVIKMEKKLIAACSRQMAIDGHVIGCESAMNDLAEKSYKFKKLGEAQINLLMACDVNTGIPLMSRIYEGASTDKVSIKDLLGQIEWKDMLFIIDRGFYSVDNLKLLYKDEIIDGYHVLTYRDLNEPASGQENYLRHMSRGDKSYTNEGFQKAKYYMGVTVLQTREQV